MAWAHLLSKEADRPRPVNCSTTLPPAAATQGGQKVVVPPDSVAEHTARQFESFESRASAAGRRSGAGLTAKAPITRLDAGAPDLQIRATVRSSTS
jgi:hypothetical protein